MAETRNALASKITLIRHFKVDQTWGKYYNADELRKAYLNYDSVGVKTYKRKLETSGIIVTSKMHRAKLTAEFLFNRKPDISDIRLNEVPIVPFTEMSIRLPRMIWEIIGRSQWRMSIGRQPETFSQTRERLNSLLDELIPLHDEITLVCHAWVILVLKKMLVKRGFEAPDLGFVHFAKPYEFQRK